MVARELIKILVSTGQIVGKAFSQAVKREIQHSQQAAKARSAAGASSADSHKAAAEDALTGMTVQEAKQILNVADINDKEDLEKKYEHLFNVNEKSKGGSFYIQSKVVMAKERLDSELQSSTEKDTSNEEKT